MRPILPLGERYLVQRVTGEEVSQGGIVLPEGHDQGLSHDGIIIAVGKGLRWDGKPSRFDAQVGDHVVYSSRIDAREINGEMFDLVENDSLIGKVHVASH